MIVSAIGKTDPEWTRDRLLKVPVWALEDEEPQERRRRRSRRRRGDSVDVSPELRALLAEEALHALWSELSWPVNQLRLDWRRTALGALLGQALAAEMMRRAHVPKTFSDFQSLAQAYSLRN